MNKDIRIVFMGTPDFAKESLKALYENFNVTLCVTQPDRPKGRGKKLSPSPVGELCETLSIPVLKPEDLRKSPESIELIKKEKPDFIVVVAFGQILTKEVLDIPKNGAINLHASLLPEYRGAAPIQAVILDGKKVTGNTTMLMNEGLDTGDMLLKEEIEIDSTWDFGRLHGQLMEKGKHLLVKTIEEYYNGTIKREVQDDSKATYVKKFNKELAKIDFNKTSSEIVNLIRAMSPYPSAFTMYKDQKVKIGEAVLLEEGKYNNNKIVPGTILDLSKEGLKVKTNDGAIKILKIQMPGKKMVTIKDFLNGNTLEEGYIFN